MRVKRIALIGAGQLGSRHLQALTRIGVPVYIEVVDVNEVSLRIAKERFEQVSSNGNVREISYLNNLRQLTPEIDLAIIATNSDVRAQVTRQLLATKSVWALILEKILFQSERDFSRVLRLIQNQGVSAWVNCPRRMYPFYSELAKRFTPFERVFYEVHGGNWGLASNAIHFIDQMAFLTKCFDYRLDISGLDRELAESKREGFVEITGTLHCYFSNGSELVLHSRAGSSAPLSITILGENCQLIVHENRGLANLCTRENGWVWETEEFRVPYQSELTHLAAQDIFAHNNCALTPLDQSVELHMPFLKGVRKYLKKVSGRKTPLCPIT